MHTVEIVIIACAAILGAAGLMLDAWGDMRERTKKCAAHLDKALTDRGE